MHLVDFGGAGPPALFSHANGYPPGSYRRMFEPILAALGIRAVEFRPLWQPLGDAPKLAGWGVFVDDLIALVERQFTAPVHAFGHSMGAVATMLAASSRPDLFRCIALIDPVFLPASHVLVVRLTPRRWRENMSMMRKAINRPHHWDSRDHAYAFHRRARAFANVPDDVLWDYISAATSESAGGGVELVYPGIWEAAVYGSVPYVWSALRRCRVPMLALRGSASDVVSDGAWHRWQKLHPEAEFVEIAQAGHLVPLERPRLVGEAVRDFFELH
jgi:pimeloyl-ACP methyl ester carboxylesterase